MGSLVDSILVIQSEYTENTTELDHRISSPIRSHQSIASTISNFERSIDKEFLSFGRYRETFNLTNRSSKQLTYQQYIQCTYTCSSHSTHNIHSTHSIHNTHSTYSTNIIHWTKSVYPAYTVRTYSVHGTLVHTGRIETTLHSRQCSTSLHLDSLLCPSCSQSRPNSWSCLSETLRSWKQILLLPFVPRTFSTRSVPIYR